MHDVSVKTFYQAFDKRIVFEFKGVSYCYPNGVEALKDINLNIYQGDRLAVVGRNGSGKTTLGKLLAGLYRPSSGEIICNDKDALRVGMVFQDADDQLFCPTLFEDIVFGLLNQGFSLEEAKEKAVEVSRLFKIDPYLYKEPHNLSYGQRKRGAMVAVLAMEPDVLILDEPTAYLDRESEEIILKVLEDFSGTLIVISHDLFFLYHLCDRALVLKDGTVHHDFTMADLISERKHLKDHGLDFTFRFACCGDFKGNSEKPGRLTTIKKSENIISLENYSYRYPDGTVAIEGINLDISKGERIALIGENGAGKSTLSLCLVGALEGEGLYRFHGQKVSKKELRKLWKKIGLVFQEPRDQLFCSSCYEEIAFGLRRLGTEESLIREKVERALELVGLRGYEERVPYHLSGGEQRRLAIASVISMEPEVIILDEPTNNLDPEGEKNLLNLLENLEGSTLIIISHDLCFLSFLCDRVIVLSGGKLIRDEDFGEFFEEDIRRSFGHHHEYRHRCCREIRKIFYGMS